jgi:hypothetical protein
MKKNLEEAKDPDQMHLLRPLALEMDELDE